MYKVTVLTKEEEDLCFEKYNKTKQLQDLEPVFKSIYFFIEKMIKGRSIGFYDKEDLLQECFLNIIEKIDTFDASKGFRFNTYATNPIFLQRILNRIYKRCNTIKRGGDLDILCLDTEIIEATKDESPTIEDTIIYKNLVEKLHETVSCLGTITKKRISSYIEGKTPKELNCSPQQLYDSINSLKLNFHKNLKRGTYGL